MNCPDIPKQLAGNAHDIVHMYCLNSLSEAQAFYQTARKRLLDINNWHQIMAKGNIQFTLSDPRGKQLGGPPQPGDFIRIDLPGPGNPSGQGYDWVQIVDLQESPDEFVAFTVSPVPNPISQSDVVAHFYDGDASSTFIVRRIENCVYAEAHGRNEKKNIPEKELADRVRNTIVNIGAKLGFSQMQWELLTKKIVAPDAVDPK